MLRLSSILLLALATVAFAHTDEILDKTPAPHGGQVRMAGPYHIELVSDATQVKLYITDHAQQMKDVSQAKAQATVLDGKQVSKLDFSPQGKETLNAKAVLSKNEKLQVVVVLTMPGDKPVQAKFTPNKKISTPHQHDTDEHHDHSHQNNDHQHKE